MLKGLNTGEGLRPKSAVRKLRDFLASDQAQLFTRSVDRGLSELVLQAIALDVQGKPCADLHAGLEGANYFRGLQAKRVKKVASFFRLKNERAAEEQRKAA